MPRNKNARRAGNFGEEQRDGLTNGNQLLSADTSLDYRRGALDLIEKALHWQRYATRWRIDNADAWHAFEEYAEQCIAEEQTLSGNALHAIVKRHDFVNARTGKTTTLNRTVLPLFARWLLIEHPSLRVELRRSFFDVLFDFDGEEAAQ